MINRFYVYKDNDRYIVIKDNLELGRSKNIDRASYWGVKKKAESWKWKIIHMYPNAILEEVKFTLVNPN